MAIAYHIGVDVGGTFTNLALSDAQKGRLVTHEEPSTPAAPEPLCRRFDGLLAALG